MTPGRQYHAKRVTAQDVEDFTDAMTGSPSWKRTRTKRQSRSSPGTHIRGCFAGNSIAVLECPPLHG
jgi:hypothetical protein